MFIILYQKPWRSPGIVRRLTLLKLFLDLDLGVEEIQSLSIIKGFQLNMVGSWEDEWQWIPEIMSILDDRILSWTRLAWERCGVVRNQTIHVQF